MYFPGASIVTSSGWDPPRSSARFLSHSVSQIRSTEEDMLPRAHNFLFPLHPSLRLYMSTSCCLSRISLSCLLFTRLRTLINANLRTHTQNRHCSMCTSTRVCACGVQHVARAHATLHTVGYVTFMPDVLKHRSIPHIKGSNTC